MKTIVVNLFAGPGCGKSTTAAGLFATLKMVGTSTELITEYVKSWAWEKRTIGPDDGLYILAKQYHRQQTLVGKVDVAVTDSPLWLGALYEQFYSERTLVTETLRSIHTQFTQRDDMQHLNYLIPRVRAYDPRGRYETEDQAHRIDQRLLRLLAEEGIDYKRLQGDTLQDIDTISTDIITYQTENM